MCREVIKRNFEPKIDEKYQEIIERFEFKGEDEYNDLALVEI